MGERLDDVKGKAKEAVGDITDDRGLQAEGKIDQGKAEVKERAKDITDKVGDKLKNLTD